MIDWCYLLLRNGGRRNSTEILDTYAFIASVKKLFLLAAPMPNQSVPLEQGATSSIDTITFTLPANVFHDQNGPIEFYAVYITTPAYQSKNVFTVYVKLTFPIKISVSY